MSGPRVVVVGNTCAGKSTFARRLSQRIGARFIELDALYWKPGWTGSERSEFRAKVDAATRGDAWVLAGNYTRAQQDISWRRASDIVWLDLPLQTILPRLVTRIWKRWRSHELLWGTNRETVFKHLKLWDPDTSLLSFAIRHHRERRRLYAAAMRDPRWNHATFHRLRTPGEADGWLDRVVASVAAS